MAQKSTRSNPGAQGEQAGRTVAPKPEAIICPTYHKEKYSTTIFYDLFGRGDTLNFIIFLTWWIRIENVVTWVNYFVTSFILFWSFGLPGYFFFFVNKMKRVNKNIEIPDNWRIAMVVTKAPSEPFGMVKTTLTAMLNQKHKHDTWLADEDPTEDVIKWCDKNKVQISSRKGLEAYHRNEWPRRTKCKEGNLAFFYDKYGYENYDFVVQLDADHVPQKNYLETMIRPFVRNTVGYVSAPSICNLNESQSWAARGRLYAESIMHGPLQAGHSDGFAPLCIGSHYAVRTNALKEIGGLGPELAEDHSTTLMMNGFGWKGIHAYDAIAYGNGPDTFADCVTQEFQWSRSLTILLLTETPKYWPKLSFWLKLQFLFSQLWYSLFSGIILIGQFIPIYAIFTKEPFVSVSYIEFLLHSVPITFSIIAIVWFLKKNQWLRPVNSPVISWEATLFFVARWPWALMGCIMGVLTVLIKKQTSFKVTPKGEPKSLSLSWKLLYPYLSVTLLSFIPSLIVYNAKDASGYYYFLIMNVMIYIVLMFCIILIHRNEAKKTKIKG